MNKSIIVMGEYPQNCGLEKEPIEWIVLKEEEHCCLCISKYLLDCKQYHNLSEIVIWQDCTLRNWLNHDFLMTAFSAEEREKILLSDIINPAKNTQDYIFLLSPDEAEEYFEFKERGAATTAYAREQGAWFLEDDCDDKNNGGWVLRYYGVEDDEGGEEGKYDFITVVNFDGYIEYGADDVIAKNVCIRPAFWLKRI